MDLLVRSCSEHDGNTGRRGEATPAPGSTCLPVRAACGRRETGNHRTERGQGRAPAAVSARGLPRKGLPALGDGVLSAVEGAETGDG